MLNTLRKILVTKLEHPEVKITINGHWLHEYCIQNISGHEDDASLTDDTHSRYMIVLYDHITRLQRYSWLNDPSNKHPTVLTIVPYGHLSDHGNNCVTFAVDDTVGDFEFSIFVRRFTVTNTGHEKIASAVKNGTTDLIMDQAVLPHIGIRRRYSVRCVKEVPLIRYCNKHGFRSSTNGESESTVKLFKEAIKIERLSRVVDHTHSTSFDSYGFTEFNMCKTGIQEWDIHEEQYSVSTNFISFSEQSLMLRRLIVHLPILLYKWKQSGNTLNNIYTKTYLLNDGENFKDVTIDVLFFRILHMVLIGSVQYRFDSSPLNISLDVDNTDPECTSTGIGDCEDMAILLVTGVRLACQFKEFILENCPRGELLTVADRCLSNYKAWHMLCALKLETPINHSTVILLPIARDTGCSPIVFESTRSLSVFDVSGPERTCLGCKYQRPDMLLDGISCYMFKNKKLEDEHLNEAIQHVYIGEDGSCNSDIIEGPFPYGSINRKFSREYECNAV